jgi:hypothetical protein
MRLPPRAELRLAQISATLLWLAFGTVFAAEAAFVDTFLIRLGCAILAVVFVQSTFRIHRPDAHETYLYWHAIPATVGVILATTGWLLADPSHWLDATYITAFWTGLQIALVYSEKQKAAKLQRAQPPQF